MLHSRKRRRTLMRSTHLALGVPLGFAIYAPPELAESVRLGLQVVGFPALVLTGLWLWLAPRITVGVKRSPGDKSPQTPPASCALCTRRTFSVF